MIVLGIDPGSRRMGYGLIEHARGRTRLIEAGLIKIKSKNEPDALLEIKNGLARLIKKWRPEILAIEKIFFARNQKTVIAVAQARGVVLACAMENKLKIAEFSPNEIKSGVCGYGFADKRAVLKMVRLILREPDLKLIDDASDALALAIFGGQCGLWRQEQKTLDKRVP